VARLVDKRSKRVRADLEAVKWPALRQMLCALPFAAVPIMMDDDSNPFKPSNKKNNSNNKAAKGFPGNSGSNEPEGMAQRLLKLEVAMDELTSMTVTQSVKVNTMNGRFNFEWSKDIFKGNVALSFFLIFFDALFLLFTSRFPYEYT